MVRSDLASLPAYVPGATIPGALKLASNESSQNPLPSVEALISDATAHINRYPDMGAVELRKALAEFVQPKSASTSPTAEPLTWAHVAVGNGSSALCLQTIQATCADGDEVVFAWRSFEAYPILCKVAGAVPVQVPLDAEHRHDLDAMASAITEKTKLVFVCNPNNPSGTTITSEEFEQFMAKVPSDVQVILDEAYTEYDRSDNGPLTPFIPAGAARANLALALEKYPNLAICRTFSKAYGLAGIRLGYLVGHTPFVEAVNKVGIPFGVNALAQAAGIASLDAQSELLERVEASVTQRSRVLNAIREWAPELHIASQANFVWLPVGDKAVDLNAALQAEGIIARCFGGEGVRITVTTEEEIDRLLPALKKALEATGLTS
ncbi:pyridoxal phosphate-dependent aminotransferase [Corynebacterium anserum]|uniref:Aromatic amino acid aminotransferase n=1 Tax=Corynebacterium anserum TaxID=2684406 RepID=A0A7G7YQJ0_9CORY|nr:pyridoxal phosphate-dependent aminotransferase [Corynebacterium anserum]MBC2682450.1 aminotransferase class I/II-fold pyridoxal phosphate-dependent enzyme [Corynebacterium anserum]QNH96760.1 aminotransferase class I/II-fold pyridoxal phosphate-dependent enzyme [Corynebacterium anserum]